VVDCFVAMLVNTDLRKLTLLRKVGIMAGEVKKGQYVLSTGNALT
jgi:hypothetical protein